MATALRLLRTGTTKRPFYRMVVIDQARANTGGIIENLGVVPVVKAADKPQLNAERVAYWLSKGVVTSESAKGVLKGLGLWVLAAPSKAKPKSKTPKVPKKVKAPKAPKPKKPKKPKAEKAAAPGAAGAEKKA